jgi:streptogramin lyase
MNLSPQAKTTILLLLILILTGCAPTPAAPTPTAVTSTPLPPAATLAPTEIPTPTLTPTPTPIYLTAKDEENNAAQERTANLPNPWTDIAVGKYTVFPGQNISPYIEYVFDKKSGMWHSGSFGVLHKDLDDNHHWYPFPQTYLTNIVVSPSGEIWVTGSKNSIYRFDNEQWIDESTNLPLFFGEDGNKYCSSDTITCIDFGPENEVWVMNDCMEIHYQKNGVWEQFPFHMDKIGIACMGMLVNSEKDIQVKIHPG